MKVYFAVVGVVLLTLGFYLLYRRIKLFRHSSVTNGTLVSYQPRSDNDGTYYHLIVRFSAQDGNTHELVSVAGSSWKPHSEGHPFRVRYNPLNPKEAFIDSFLHFWAAPVGCIVLGMAGVAAILAK